MKVFEAIQKYSRHIGSMVMSDNSGSIVAHANHLDCTMSVNVYYLWFYYSHFSQLYSTHSLSAPFLKRISKALKEVITVLGLVLAELPDH